MGSKEARVQAATRNPLGNQPRILTRCETTIGTFPATEQKFASLFAIRPHIFIERLPCLFGDFKANRVTSFLLPDGSAVNCIATWCNVLHSNGHDITAAKFAVYSKIE